jgi:hypothetical protein
VYLHNDLFHANLIHSPSCSCGYSTGNAEHFLLYCKRFDAQRNILYRSLLAANVYIYLNTSLFGSQIYNIDTNRHVFITVQTYIKETCRFPFRWFIVNIIHFSDLHLLSFKKCLWILWRIHSNCRFLKIINETRKDKL